jgi:arginyl-tRNA synthetase
VAKTLKAKDGDRWLKATEDEVVPGIRAFVVDEMMKVIKDDLTALGVPFDTFFSEYAMHDSGRTKKAVEVLRAKGYVYEGVLEAPKGKTPDDWEPVELTLFKSTVFGDDVDRPLYKSDGSFTYFGADVAYHQIKLERGFDRLINVWGADHGGTVKRVQAAIEALTGRKGALDVKLMQMVKLTRGGQPVKMSKRAGNFVTLREVVDEVGADAIRFWFLSRREDSQLDFDLQKAVEKNNDNPVFYAQYAHARMCAVYRQAHEQGISMPDAAKADLNLLTHPAEQALMRVLAAWPHTVERAADAAEPHRLVFYAGELAAAFHSWYNAERFLHADNLPLTHARLILVEASRIVLRSVFEVISVSAPERM